MKISTKQVRNWKISYLNEAEVDEMTRELYQKHFYHLQINKSNPVIFDVGALIGETILYFKEYYPQAKIIAFEPSPRSFKLLYKNIHQNHLSDVKLINAAVSDKEGTMDFYIDKNPDKPWGRGDSLKPSQFNNPQLSKMVKVSTVKLSKYINGPIDLLKIDIEGAETEVIQEIEPKLKYVKQLLLEFHSSIFNPENKYSLISDSLIRHGYKIRVFLSRWFIPEFTVPFVLFAQRFFRIKELWFRIYAQQGI